MNTGVIIQARMGSSRLPGKVLMKLPIQSEFTVLDRIINRIPKKFDYCIGTSDRSSDDIIFDAYDNVYRGSESDVLSRFYKIASLKKYDNIIRLTGDNACIDPGCMAKTVQYHINTNSDYTMSTGLPLGCNIELFTFKTLEQTYKRATSLADKEHVTLFMKNNPKLFKIGVLKFDFANEILDMRFSIDYPSDYAMVNLLYSVLAPNFSLSDLCKFVKKNAWIKSINSGNKQKTP